MNYLYQILSRYMGIIALAILLSACANDSDNSADNGVSLQAMSDEFDGDLSAWSTLNDTDAAVQTEAGQLIIEPLANTLWFNSSAGVLVHKSISGNFIASAYVTARRASDDLAVPINVNLGGLMAHDSATTATIQNYVHVAVGSLQKPVAENKTTVDGASIFTTIEWLSAEAELRICRINDSFTLLIRERDAAWQTLAVYIRSDLPDTLQVGAMSYSDSSADLRVSFEYLRFQPASRSSDCTS